MALKRIEPGRTGVSLTTTVARKYKDLDLSFSPKRGTMFEDGVRRGDVYKKEDIRAIDQAIKTLLLTNRYEKPFQPLFGGNLRSLLFGLSTQVSEDEVRDTIVDTLRKHEPRVQVLGVEIFDAGASKQVPRGIENVFFYSTGVDPARYSLIITVYSRIKTTGVDITTQINMNRLR